ncbi:hypothetical protein DL96DRAFT_1703987 [Flagelloscypha sp. PMI_526]|nr:hypothetical protein DL96DRAFT_1703987 [Flagelloscypha sp. PMI_526]
MSAPVPAYDEKTAPGAPSYPQQPIHRQESSNFQPQYPQASYQGHPPPQGSPPPGNAPPMMYPGSPGPGSPPQMAQYQGGYYPSPPAQGYYPQAPYPPQPYYGAQPQPIVIQQHTSNNNNNNNNNANANSNGGYDPCLGLCSLCMCLLCCGLWGF